MIRNKIIPSMVVGQVERFGAEGTHIRCLQGNAAFELRAYWKSDLVFVSSTWQTGLAFGPLYIRQAGADGRYEDTFQSFDQIEVINGTTAQTVELIYGDGEVVDNRLVGTVNITGALLTSPIGADTADAAGVVTLAAATGANGTLIKAATTNGVDLLIQNRSTTITAIITQNSTTITGTTMATAVGIALAPDAAGNGGGGSIIVSGGLATYGVGIGGTCVVAYHATKETP